MTRFVVVSRSPGGPLYIASTSRVTLHLTDELARAARYGDRTTADGICRRASFTAFARCRYTFTVELITE